LYLEKLSQKHKKRFGTNRSFFCGTVSL